VNPTPPCSTVKRDSARLSLFVAGALILHLILLSLVKIPPKTGSFPTQQFVFRWVRQPLDSAALAGTAPGESLLHDGASGKRQGAATMPPSDWKGPPQEKSGHEETLHAPHPSRTDLIESARKIIRQMTYEQGKQGQGASTPIDRPILPALDRALRERVAGEKRLVDGLIQITAESGRVYCLQAPPDFARGGPVEAMAVATNCP